MVNPKDGTIYTLNPLNGSKEKYGQFKDNKMTITKDDTVVNVLTGEYRKTKDPVPDQKVLDYNVWKAEKDKLQAYKEKRKISRILLNLKKWPMHRDGSNNHIAESRRKSEILIYGGFCYTVIFLSL